MNLFILISRFLTFIYWERADSTRGARHCPSVNRLW